jgi:hypothetical protein
VMPGGRAETSSNMIALIRRKLRGEDHHLFIDTRKHPWWDVPWGLAFFLFVARDVAGVS